MSSFSLPNFHSASYFFLLILPLQTLTDEFHLFSLSFHFFFLVSNNILYLCTKSSTVLKNETKRNETITEASKNYSYFLLNIQEQISKLIFNCLNLQ